MEGRSNKVKELKDPSAYPNPTNGEKGEISKTKVIRDEKFL